MSVLVSKLLAGSGVSAASHPVLVGLLEVAARGPSVFDKGKRGALSRRLSRHWARVGEAFRACCRVGVTDNDLWKVVTFGLFFDRVERSWRVLPSVGHNYRLRVAEALEALSVQKEGHVMRAVVIASLEDLREARKMNGLPPMGKLEVNPTRIESGLVGGRFVMSWLMFGARVFFVLQHDEYGALRWLAVREKKAEALAVLNPLSVS